MVDGIDNKVGMSYAAWPDRLYIIGMDGKVAYMGAPGPGGFSAAALVKRLESIVAESVGKK